ncbi:MAG TPA: class E sortase [Solirubrobacteraceae bacterium]|jgi:sortase A|nr:class E sortase [Solirubrobacteraceae bacterium]
MPELTYTSRTPFGRFVAGLRGRLRGWRAGRGEGGEGAEGGERGPRSARALRALAFALIGVGSLALLDGAITLVWEEPLSAIYATFRQEHLRGALRAVERAQPTPTERRALASLSDQQARITFLARELERRAGDGGAVGRIVIPSIGASFVVVKGTSTEDLESGPGVYPETGFPGVPGTTAIAGHRTTYLAPFRHIDALRHGNRILLEMPYAHLTYTVLGQRIVAPTNVEAAVGQVGYTRLVLSACTPLYSAAKRILVYARLARIVPVGAARQLPRGVLARPIEAATATARASRPPAAPSPVQGSLPAVLEPIQQHLLPPLNQ